MNAPFPSGVLSCCKITVDRSERDRFISTFGLSLSEVPVPEPPALLPEEPTDEEDLLPGISGYFKHFSPDIEMIDETAPVVG